MVLRFDRCSGGADVSKATVGRVAVEYPPVPPLDFDWETFVMSRSETSKRSWVEVEQRLFWRVDVTDFLDDPDDPSARERDLREIARGVLDYKQYQIGDGVECDGYGWVD